MEESQEEDVLTGNFEENTSFEGEYADVHKLERLCDVIKLSLRSISRNIIFKHRLSQVIDAFRSSANHSSTEDVTSRRTEVAPLIQTTTPSYSTPDHPSVVAAYDAFVEEIDKTEKFYKSHHDEIEKRYKALLKAHRGAPTGKQEDFEAEFVELYRQCFFLREFSLVNFSKLLSLINSHFRINNTFLQAENERMSCVLDRYLYRNEFSKGKATKTLSKQICKTFADFYCMGSIPVANMRLLAKRHEDIQFSSCRVGLWAGAALLSAAWFCFDLLAYSEVSHLHDSGGARVFRLLRCGLLIYLGVCCQIYVWRQSRVNFPFIFKINADLWPSNSTLFLSLGRLATLYFLMHLAFIKVSQKEFPLLHPIVAAYVAIILAGSSLVNGVYVVWTLIPRSSERRVIPRFKHFWKTIFLAITGQTNRAFFTSYITNYLTSSSKLLQDLGLLICDLSSPDRVGRMLTYSESCADRLKLVIPVVMVIPISIRMIQNVVRLYLTRRNWPFLPNAVKYAVAHTIVIYSTLYPSFLLSPFAVSVIFLLSTVTFLWDVTVDWGLGHAKYKFLRKRLMLRKSTLYYFAVALDFIMRYFWTLTLIPKYNTSARWLLVITAFSTELELIRRGFWGVLRVENEHLTNTRGFRNVSFTPLYFDHPPPPKKQKASRVSFAIMLEIASITAATFTFAIVAIVRYE